MGRSSPARHDELQHKLFVGGISHKFRDADLKQAFHQYGSVRATVMIDRKTGRSRGFGFVYLDHHDALRDAIQEMHGAVLDGRKISVTRAVPETQTMPGTPAPLLAAGKGIRGGRGIRGGTWEGSDGIRGSPRGARGGRGKRFEKGGRYKSGGSSGRSRGRSPFDRQYRGHSRDRSRSISIDRHSRGSSADSQGSLQRPHGTPAPNFPAYESALSVLKATNYDESGFREYMEKCKPLDMTGWIVLDADDGDSPAPVKRKESSRRGSLDRGERERSTWPQQQSFHDATPSGVGGMRGTTRPRDRGTDREQISSVRGRPERYSRDLR